MPDPQDAPGLTPRRSVKRGTSRGTTEQVAQMVTAEKLAAAKAASEHRRRVQLEKLSHDQKLEQDDAILRRRKEWMTLRAVLAFGAFLSATCAVVLFAPGSPAELRDKALTGLFGLMTAALGFVAGKGFRKE